MIDKTITRCTLEGDCFEKSRLDYSEHDKWKVFNKYEDVDITNFDVLGLKPTYRDPKPIKTEHDLLIVKLGKGKDKKEFVAYLHKNDKVVFVAEKQCYVVTDSLGKKHMMIFVDNENKYTCCFDFKKMCGYISYNVDGMVRFNLEKIVNFFDDERTEYFTNCFVMGTTNNTSVEPTHNPAELKEEFIRSIEDNDHLDELSISYRSPICVTYDGLRIAPPGEFFHIEHSISYDDGKLTSTRTITM